MSESNSVMMGVSSEIDDDAKANQSDQGKDFDRAEPEFQFSENTDAPIFGIELELGAGSERNDEQ